MILKVMSGDQFSIRATSWYNTNGTTPGTAVNLLPDLLAALISGAGSIPGHVTPAQLSSNSATLSSNLSQFLSDTGANIIDIRPRAFVNWVLFDNQMNYVSSSSGFDQVGGNEEFKHHILSNLQVDQSGYLYIYLSNETPNIDVFFDNLQVTHVRGPMLEEDHYYPFGLTMAGISDKVLKNGYAENKYRWNKGSELQNKEFSDGSGLEEYDTYYRQLDPQTGRWNEIDPKAEEQESISPYQAMSDDPMLKNDPMGDEDDPPKKGFWSNVGNAVMTGVVWINENLNPLNDAVEAVTGRDYNLAGAPAVSRTEAVASVGLALAGGKIEGAIIKDVEKAVVKDVLKGGEKVVAGDKARFIVEKDGVTVDTKATPKGSYEQPNGGRTDVLQDKSHYNKSTKENVGQSHTHEPYSHTNMETGKTYSGADNTKAHRPTDEEVKNIVTGRAKKID